MSVVVVVIGGDIKVVMITRRTRVALRVMNGSENVGQ